ncbi:hypothetical protein DHB64_01325 [Antarcticibacterium sp. W02-3]|nr:hypothetical protein [Antarcticibacterium sp. W02-3]
MEKGERKVNAFYAAGVGLAPTRKGAVLGCRLSVENIVGCRLKKVESGKRKVESGKWRVERGKSGRVNVQSLSVVGCRLKKCRVLNRVDRSTPIWILGSRV